MPVPDAPACFAAKRLACGCWQVRPPAAWRARAKCRQVAASPLRGPRQAFACLRDRARCAAQSRANAAGMGDNGWLQKRSREGRRDVGASISPKRSLAGESERYAHAVKELKQVYGFDFVSIGLTAFIGAPLKWIYSAGATGERYRRIVLAPGHGIGGIVIKAGKPMMFVDIDAQIDPRADLSYPDRVRRRPPQLLRVAARERRARGGCAPVRVPHRERRARIRVHEPGAGPGRAPVRLRRGVERLHRLQEHGRAGAQRARGRCGLRRVRAVARHRRAGGRAQAHLARAARRHRPGDAGRVVSAQPLGAVPGRARGPLASGRGEGEHGPHPGRPAQPVGRIAPFGARPSGVRAGPALAGRRVRADLRRPDRLRRLAFGGPLRPRARDAGVPHLPGGHPERVQVFGVGHHHGDVRGSGRLAARERGRRRLRLRRRASPDQAAAAGFPA